MAALHGRLVSSAASAFGGLSPPSGDGGLAPPYPHSAQVRERSSRFIIRRTATFATRIRIPRIRPVMLEFLFFDFPVARFSLMPDT